jgi:hypothetical protein
MPDLPALTPCTCRQAIHASEHATPVDGCPWCLRESTALDADPSVAEAAADDRRWELEKRGE